MKTKYALVILDLTEGQALPKLSNRLCNIYNALCDQKGGRVLTANAWVLFLPESWVTMCEIVALCTGNRLGHHVALLEDDPFVTASGGNIN